MNEEEKFDELLSSKLSERDFPFDELNWDEAERLIIQQERRRKMLRFGLIFSGGLAAGICIMLPFLLSTHSTLPNNIVINNPTNTQNQVVQNNALPISAKSQATTNTTTTNKEDQAPQPVQSAFVKKETSTGRRGKFHKTNSVSSAPDKGKSIIVADISKPHRNHKLKVPTDLIASAKTTNNKPIQTETTNGTTTTTAQELSNTSAMVALNNTNAKNSAVSNNVDAIVKNNIVTNTTKSNNNNSENNIVSNKTSATNNTSPPATKKDSSDISPPMLPGPIALDNTYSKNILSAYAGGNYSFGWKNSSATEGNGLTLMGGFSFTRYFIRTLSASIGVGYSELTNLNKTYTSNLIQYDFGANSSVTTVTPQTAYYIAIPLEVQANLDDKDRISLGLDCLLLLTTNCILTTYQQNYFSQSAPTTEKQNGYTQGFSNSDVQVTLAYTRMLTDRLGITAAFYHDLSNIENSSFPGINGVFPKNNGFRLILSYQLMK